MRQRRVLPLSAQRRAKAVAANFEKTHYCEKHDLYCAKFRRLGTRIVKRGCLSC